MARYKAVYYRGELLAEYCDGVLTGGRSGSIGEKTSSGPQVVRDIEPYKSMITGEMITSRSTHRDHLRAHGCIEVGNEIKAAMTRPEPKRQDTRKQLLHSILGDKSDKQVRQIIRDQIRGRS